MKLPYTTIKSHVVQNRMQNEVSGTRIRIPQRGKTDFKSFMKEIGMEYSTISTDVFNYK